MKLAVATRWCATLWCGSNRRRPSRTGCCATPCPGGHHVMIVTMNFDVIIVGGGLVGASLAAALKRSGLSLALVESQPAPVLDRARMAEWDSRIYAISPGSRSFLEQSGAWSLLDASRIAPVEAMRVFGDTGAELEFSAYQMGVAELACILENRALQHALWEVLQQQENLTLLQPACCASISFADPRTITDSSA